MELGFRAIALDRVIGRGVDVPAYHIEGFIAVMKMRKGCIDAFGVSDSIGWAIAPVVEIPFDVSRVGESGDVNEREALSDEQRNRRLLGANLAERVV